MSKNLITKEIADAIDDLVAVISIGGTPECAAVGDTDEYNEIIKNEEDSLKKALQDTIKAFLDSDSAVENFETELTDFISIVVTQSPGAVIVRQMVKEFLKTRMAYLTLL